MALACQKNSYLKEVSLDTHTEKTRVDSKSNVYLSNVRMLHYFDFYTISKDQHSSLTIHLLIHIQGDHAFVYVFQWRLCLYVICLMPNIMK